MGAATSSSYPRHDECTAHVSASPESLFTYLDDHARLSGHMSERSWMMGGGRMDISTDGGGGRRLGSHITLDGRVFGMRLRVEEVVVGHQPPHCKRWETIGEPRLLIIGPYRMGFAIVPDPPGSRLRVEIDYALPTAGLSRLLGRLLGPFYARWCTRQMAGDAARHFAAAPMTHVPISDAGQVAR
jgi:hypothetical protein